MRVGFTILFNGRHHLEHNDYGDRLAKMLDMWIVVEGPAKNGGSTSWCHEIPAKYINHVPGVVCTSKDHSAGYVMGLKQKHGDHIGLVLKKEPWESKDQMVNSAVEALSCQQCINAVMGYKPIFLWQIDVDEQWTEDDMEAAEIDLLNGNAKCGCFHANMFLGKNLLAKGTWGEGNDPQDPLRNAYRRLWLWDGRSFVSHEPPVLNGGNGKEVLLKQRFNHYAYWNHKDVEFKQDYYGYVGMLGSWMALQDYPEDYFPRDLSDLIPGHWGKTDTKICYMK